MKVRPHIIAALLVVCTIGCSGISTVEQANLTKLESREHFIAMNPNSLFCEYIRNGEIVRGMNIYEVIASWGLPNVYLVSRRDPSENWIYYVEDPDSRSILIYTLTFREDLLDTWDIDMERFVDQRIVYDPDMPTRLVPSDWSARKPAKP
jgi:hypothetical protein